MEIKLNNRDWVAIIIVLGLTALVTNTHYDAFRDYVVRKLESIDKKNLTCEYPKCPGCPKYSEYPEYPEYPQKELESLKKEFKEHRHIGIYGGVK